MFVKAVPVILDRLEEKIKTAAQKVELLRQENKLLHGNAVALGMIGELEDQRNLFSEYADSPKVSHRKVEHALDQYIRQVDQCVEMVKNIG